MNASNRLKRCLSLHLVLVVLALLAATCLTSASARGAGVEPTRISLPQGPASVEGLGRSFVPSLASGTASYGVDITVPPASGGFAPKLSLDYDGGSGASEVGLGFRISGIPSIRRRTQDGLPRFDESDSFELVGLGIPSELLEMPDGYYRPECEAGSFVRVERSEDGERWEARTKAGTIFRFGGDGFTEAEGENVATYLLREMVDLHGHRISYDWDTSSGYALLQAVVWNDYSKNVRQRVEFKYDTRPDMHTLFSSGVKRVLAMRVTAIEVTHGGDLVRRYTLGYADGDRSLLTSVRMVGTDGSTALPELALSYTEPSFATDGQVTRMTHAPVYSPAEANVALADLNGDGLTDLLVTEAGHFHSYVNHDGTTWKPVVDWSAANSPSLTLAATGVGMADLDGDGALDLFAKSGTNSFRYLPGKDASSFGAPKSIKTVPNVTFEDPDVHLVDLDGDRRPDLAVTSSTGLAVGYNLGGSDWSLPEAVGKIDPKQELRFSDGKTLLCDVNGDHVQDICNLYSGSLLYWLGRGRGVFEAAAKASGVPEFDATDPWKLVDLNADGWVDLVHVGVNQVDYALAIAEGNFDAPRAVARTPEKGPDVDVQFADMNGSGTTDVVWVQKGTAGGTVWRYLELFPNGRAGLLKSIDNGIGKLTRITYKTAAEDATVAREGGKPWNSRINVGMPVIASVEIDDQLGDPTLVTEYTYSDGTWDARERTFAGFGGGTESAIGDDSTPTLVTESTFDTGLEDRTLRGAVLSSEQRDGSGKVFSRTANTYKVLTLGKSREGREVQYAYKSDETVQHVEGRADSELRVTEKSWEQDELGNVIKEADWGEVSDDDVTVGNDEAITIRTFANNIDDWVFGFVATEELTDADGHRVAMSRLYYDGDPFQGLPLRGVARGDVSRREAWVGPKPDDFELELATKYDGDGNPVETKDARGGGRLFEFDSTDHTTLLSERVKLESGVDLIEVADTDPRFGNLRSVTDYAGQVTSFEYDELGRLSAVFKPGDPKDQPSIRYGYDVRAPLSRVLTQIRTWAGRDDFEQTELLFDGLGRKRGALTRDNADRWVLAGVSLLDARGEARRTLRPRFVKPPDVKEPPLLTDGLGVSLFRDALGRETGSLSQGGIETRTEFLPLGKRHWDGGQTDPKSPYEHVPAEEVFDGRGRIVTATRWLQGKAVFATFTYDAAGHLLTRTDPESNLVEYEYDGRGRRTRVVDPDLGERTFVYDPAGNLTERHFPDGITATYSFDLAGRSLSEDWDDDGQPEVVRTWDRLPERAGNELDRGHLVRVTEPSGSTEHEYDVRGRVTATTVTIDGHAYRSGSRYDNQDREAEHIYPDGSSIRIDRNARGQLASYANGAVTFEYDGDGLELRRKFGTGVVQTSGYDADRRLDEMEIADADGTAIEHLRWAFDGVGNLSSVSDLRAHVSVQEDRSESYTYDNLYRLTRAKGSWGQTDWTYSASGNLLERTSSVKSQHSGRLAYDGAAPHAPNKIGGRALAYDERGRLTDDGDRTYTWNAADQLESVSSSSGASEENTFDAEGIRRLRIEKGADGTKHRVEFISPWSEVEDGTLVRYIVHGGRRIIRLAQSGPATANVAQKHANLEPSSRSPMRAFGKALSRAGDLAMVSLLAFSLLCFFWRSRAKAVLRLVPVLGLFAAVACGGDGTSGSPSVTGDAPNGGAASANPDARGSVQQLSSDDVLLFSDQLGSLLAETKASGAAVGRFAAYPYGATRYDSSKQTRKFANSIRDNGVGLDLMGARVYAPDLGIWTAGDPVLVNAPERAVGGDFAAANPYAYANLNPVVVADEDGHFGHIIAGAVIGAVIGGGIEAARQYIAHGKVEDWGRVGAAAVAGGVGGAVTAACPAAGLGGVMAVGATSGVASGATERLVASGGQSAGTLKDVVIDAGVGAASAGLAKGAVPVLKAAAQKVVPKARQAVGAVAGKVRAAIRPAAPHPEGSFSITNWNGYPAGMSKPTGPVRILNGDEYAAARGLADQTNAGIRAAYGLDGSGLHIHEILPVKFGGSPTDIANKMLLPAAEHIGPDGVHPKFWTPLQRWATGGK